MGKHYIDYTVVVNNVDLTDRVRSIEVNQENADLDVTAMGDEGNMHLHGLRGDSFVLGFFQDWESSEVHATLSALFIAKTEFPVYAKPTSAAASATNPRFEATCVILAYQPMAGEIGGVAMVTQTLAVQGAIAQYTSGT